MRWKTDSEQNNHRGAGHLWQTVEVLASPCHGATLALIVVPPLLSFVGPLLRPKVEEAVA